MNDDTKTKLCPNCGASFIYLRKTKRFCSQACQVAYWDKNQLLKLDSLLPDGPSILSPTKICPECHKPFIPSGRGPFRNHCSRMCRYLAAASQQRDKVLGGPALPI